MTCVPTLKYRESHARCGTPTLVFISKNALCSKKCYTPLILLATDVIATPHYAPANERTRTC